MNPHPSGIAMVLVLCGFLLGRPVCMAEVTPNFVIILADDLGYNDLSGYGSNRIHTPNIDQMAREGMRFTDFYATAPICTPRRGQVTRGQVKNGCPRATACAPARAGR